MIYINAYALTNAMGDSTKAIQDSLGTLKAPFMKQRDDILVSHKSLYFGHAHADLSLIPEELAAHRTRNNALLMHCYLEIKEAVDAAIERYGAERVGIILGTSTSGLNEALAKLKGDRGCAEPFAGYHYCMQEIGDPSLFLQELLHTSCLSYTISTACSSSSRALMQGARAIEAGLVDAVIVGGADTEAAMALNGFASMGLLSEDLCSPLGKGRQGITIGEAGGLMLLSKEKSSLALVGCGESTDGYHVSAPDPEGTYARQAMLMALDEAGIKADDLGYINMHGTATPMNDKVEAHLLHESFRQVPASSSKYLTGHCLGASGITEAVLCALMLEHDLPLIPQDFSRLPYDDSLEDFNVVREPCCLAKDFVMSNAFAFDGNNASLIFKRC